MSLPSTMRAVEITEHGKPEVLKLGERPVPQPKSGEVLVRVAAAGVNRPDVLQRMGHYPVPPGASDIPGLEIAGEVAAVGEGVGTWNVGDALCALVQGGGYAEYCTAPAAQCLPIPKGLSPVEAASLPETFFTVWSNVFDRARLSPGESFLVQGGASGIGVAAIQMAKAFGHQVLATAGSPRKCSACEELGADRAINYKTEDFASVAKEATAGRGVDVRLILPGTSDSPSAFYAGRSHYTELLEGGVRIYERRGSLLHVKTAFIDGVWSCVGSSNLDWRSALDNDEVNAVILGREFAQQMQAAYARDIVASDAIDLESWEGRSLLLRMKEWTARLWWRLL